MMSYRFKLVHLPGLRHKVADATSRYPTGAMGNKQERLTRTLVRYGRDETTDLDKNISKNRTRFRVRLLFGDWRRHGL